MFTAILFLPLLGAILTGFFARQLGDKAAMVIPTCLVGLSAVLSWVALFSVAFGGEPTTVQLFTWIESGDLSTTWAIRVDSLTAVMLVVVNTVASLVHLYSIGYMDHDPHRPRFFAYLSLFTFMMLALVTADNLVQLFFGWEGVGLASYLLIGFWFKKPSANAAAIKAFVVNRVGDFGFALGIFGVYAIVGSIDFDVIFASLDAFDGKSLSFLGIEAKAVDLICLLLFMGAMGKSAQFLLHTWLPDAMEGPTPVSALIHAATMVTAGVFMVARLSPVFEQSPNALGFVLFLGAFTAFFAASIGLVQNDIKRVIAYSTCSQLGYMFAALGSGVYSAAIFHLFTHAFFKALLFLGAGSVIHAMSNEQDMRYMGGIRRHIPITFAMMLIGTLALTGFPFFAGFYSKDAIIESVFAAHGWIGNFSFVMLVVAALFTSFYSWRLIFMTFFGKTRAQEEVIEHIHESPMVMLVPLFVLGVGAVLAGFAFYGSFLGEGASSFWGNSLALERAKVILEEIHHLPGWVPWAPTIMMVLGFVAAAYFYLLRPDLPPRVAANQGPLYRFLLNKWYIDEIYHFIFIRGGIALGKIFWIYGDGKTIDGLGPNGIAGLVARLSARVTRLQSGYLYHYAFAMLLGITGLLTFFIFAGGNS